MTVNQSVFLWTPQMEETVESPPSVVSGKRKKIELVDLVKPEDFSYAQIMKEFEYFAENDKLHKHDKYYRFNLGPMNRLVSGGRKKPHEETDEEHGQNWFYRDHCGYMRGPVSRNDLKRYADIFPRSTMVLRDGQTPDQAILLTDMFLKPSIVFGKRKRTDEGDELLLGTRKKTDEGDGAFESDISALPKMPPPEENPSKIIPLELHQLIRVALELREMLEEDDYDYLRLQLKLHEDLIKSCAKECKKLKKLSRDWKYDPTTASTFVAAKPVISALADMSPPRGEPCCCPSIKWGQKFPETKDVPLDEEEKIIWRGFKESDENQPGVSILDFNIVDKYKIPLPREEPIVSLTSKFAVTAFNEAIEMYVKKGEQNNIHDFDVVECKYLKMKDSSYYFYITIDAFEERKRGIYDAKVRLKWHDGSKSLLQFVLTDREPPEDGKTMKLEKRKTLPDSWPDVTDIPFSGMRPRRNRKGICRGYDYQDMGHVGP